MHTMRKLVAAGLLSTVVSTGTAYGALYGFGPAETWTIAQITALTSKVTAKLAAFFSSYSAQQQLKFEQIISAVAVATKQEAVSANAVAGGNVDAAEQFVNAYRAQQLSGDVGKAVLSYNPVTGQGYDPCGTVAKNKTLDIAFNAIPSAAKAIVNSTDVAPGRLVQSTANSMQQRLQDHRSKFCSESEATAGLCSVSALPGGDVNAALMFAPAPAEGLQTQARVAYMQHVLGAPDQKINKSAGSTPAGENYLFTKTRKDSLLSIPAYSLASVSAANTQTADLGNKSPNEVLSIRVNQYFGGKEAEQWAGSMARQSQRGLLVEATKMAGLETWIHHKQYEQNQRLEMNLAALLLASANGLSGELVEKYQRTLSNSAKALVK